MPNVLTQEFSWPEWLALTEKHKDHNNAWARLGSFDKSWLGAKSFEEAIALARYGWPEGMAKVKVIAAPMLDRLVPLVASGHAWEWDVTGASYDVGEYLSGAPECWLVPVPALAKPTVTLQSETYLSASTPAQAVTQRGVAVVALALALERAGYAVKIETVSGVSYYSQLEQWVRVTLTDGSGPLDIDRIVFALAHPAAIRWLGYGTECALAGIEAQSGYPCKSANPWNATLTIPDLRHGRINWSDRRAIDAWLEETFTAITTQHNGRN